MAKILTEKELKKDGGAKAPSPLKTEEKKAEKVSKKVRPVFECGFAPMGKSRAAVAYNFEGRDYKFDIDLMDKRYEIPEDISPEDERVLRKALLANNFIDVTVVNTVPVFDNQTGKWTYRVMHTDHSSQQPMNCNLTLILQNDEGKDMYDKDGKQVTKQIAIVNGFYQTDDKLVYEALLKAGFCDAGKVKKEE